jgi:hypothetical protein
MIDDRTRLAQGNRQWTSPPKAEADQRTGAGLTDVPAVSVVPAADLPSSGLSW